MRSFVWFLLFLVSAQVYAEPSLRVTKHSYSTEDDVIIEYSGLTDRTNDWISVVEAGSPDDYYTRQWQFTQGKHDGLYRIGKLAAGKYEARLYFDYPNGGFTVHSRQTFDVVASTVNSTATPNTTFVQYLNQAQHNTPPTAAAPIGNTPLIPLLNNTDKEQGRINLLCQLAKDNLVSEECLALFKLYVDLNGKHWTQQQDWAMTNRPCNWKGVSCKDLHVVALRLPNNHLMGTLAGLEKFPYLEILSLPYNQLSGSLAPLKTLKHLKQLRLNTNQLTGDLSELVNLENLEVLNLADNQFSGDLSVLMIFKQLYSLNLANNQLQDSLEIIAKLPNLVHVNVSNNKLTGKLPALSKLPNLETLDIRQNQLCGTLESSLVKTHPYLKIWVANNHLTEIADVELQHFISAIDSTALSSQTACPP